MLKHYKCYNAVEEVQEGIWFLDSGCTNHMCGDKGLFSELNESLSSEVRFGNNSRIPVNGRGKISIKLNNREQNWIGDVFYVPGLHQNLLSVGQLSEKGC